MGLFGGKKSGSGKSSNGLEKSGSPGKPGHGYAKGSATSNPDKWKARTEAQQARSDRAVDKWKG